MDLIYIASTGRSGSTLLEMLLGSFDNIWTMGEIYVLPWEIKKKGSVCGCGKGFRSCEFWAPIIHEHGSILDVSGGVSRFRDDYSTSRFFRFEELVNILFRQSIPDKRSLADFCSENRRLFSEVRRRASAYKDTEMAYLVDSSKIFYRLFWLLHCKAISTRVIHIVKDPRSFVYSKIKTAKHAGHGLRVTFRMSLRYVIENRLIETVLQNIPKVNTLFVRYEDLAAQPNEKLEEIANWLNVKYRRDATRDFRTKDNHGIAGNIMRHKKEGIYLDEEWRRSLSTIYKNVATVLTYPLAKKYSYL